MPLSCFSHFSDSKQNRKKNRERIINIISMRKWIFEPPHDKTNKMNVRPAMTQISLGIRPAWASAQSDQSSLYAQWVAKDPSFLHADSEDSDQTGWMPRLIWVFAGRTLTLLVLSWGGSFVYFYTEFQMSRAKRKITKLLSIFHAITVQSYNWEMCSFQYVKSSYQTFNEKIIFCFLLLYKNMIKKIKRSLHKLVK